MRKVENTKNQKFRSSDEERGDKRIKIHNPKLKIQQCNQ